MAEFAVGREIFHELRRSLPSQLPAFLMRQRWFGGKARQMHSAELADVIPIPTAAGDAFLMIVSVNYASGTDDTYAIPVLRSDAAAQSALAEQGGALQIEMPESSNSLTLTDALKNEAFLTALLELLRDGRSVSGEKGELLASQTSAFLRLYPVDGSHDLKPRAVGAEQSNSSTIYGDKLILKFFRRVEEGINPDLEVGNFLTERARFAHIPQVAGSLQYHSRDGKQMAQGILQAFVPNQGDAWSYTLRELAKFYDGVSQTAAGDAAAHALAARYLESATLLGRRTAEMHLALASDALDRAFAPELFTMEFQHALEKSMLELMTRVFGQLQGRLAALPPEWQNKAQEVAGRQDEIAGHFRAALSRPVGAMRTRIHGDYHLGQVLYTGSDFVIIDFEGEPARPLAERRLKRSPLQDVAGMLRSFHYAAFAPLLTASTDQSSANRNVAQLSSWAETWNRWVSERFLASYFATAGAASFIPAHREETQNLLDLHTVEKAVYELGYELNNRPTWVGIPLQGIAKLLSL